jgi:triphosphoribosyl-dephospho-CoA synthase
MSELTNTSGLSLAQALEFAMLLEVSAPKVGNVHRGADFDDVTFVDFVTSAVVSAPKLARGTSVGSAVLESIRATRGVCRTNTNLGMVLLLAPLSVAVGLTQTPSDRTGNLESAVAQVLASLSPDDSAAVYEAIRLAMPGGLGSSDEMDVRSSPPADLLAAMRYGALRDLVARQYANGFREVFREIVPWLVEVSRTSGSTIDAIVYAHLRAIATFGDTLIARKCGPEIAANAQRFAEQTLSAGDPGSEDYLAALEDFDFWLRSDGHRRNPGATADLLAAGLFVAIWENKISPPFR